MPQKPETRFKNRIRPLLEALPGTWFVKVQQQTLAGTPDFLLCVGGLFIALELKSDRSARVTPLQRYNLEKIERAGGKSFVAYPENWGDIYAELKAYAEVPKDILRKSS